MVAAKTLRWLSVCLVSVFLPSSAGAAVSVDRVGPGSTGTSCTNCAALSWSHTVATSDPNRILTVTVAIGSSQDSRTVAVRYAGVLMTSAGKVHSNNQTAGFVELFYLTGPAAGTNTVAVAVSGGTVESIEAGSVSFAGVNQTTPIRNVKTAFGTGSSPSVTVASTAGDMVVAALVNGASIAGSGQTLNWIRNVNSSTAGGNGAQSSAPGAASVNMTYSVTSDWWGLVGMDVVAATGGQTVPAISSFAASPASISQGGTSTLSWTVTGNPAPTTSLDNGIGSVSGNSVVVSPTQTTTYRLTATNASGSATATASINVTVGNQGPVGSIVINSGAAATNSGNVTLTLSATAGTVAVTQMRFSNTGTSYSNAEAYATTKAWTLSTGSGTKTVSVQFMDALGNWSGAFSDTIAVDTTAPTNSGVTSSNVTGNAATITWTTSEPATSQVEYGITTSYGSLTAIDGNLVTSHSVTVGNLSPQTLYDYRVRSRDAAGNEGLSGNRTLTTLAGPADTTPPSIPGAPTATPVSASRIDLSWPPSTDDVGVTGYSVFRGGVQIATTAATTYTNTGLSPSTAYSYTVAAFDAAGNLSAQSAPSPATTPADTTAPAVALTSPQGGAVLFGSTTLTATASDDIQVAGVTFLVGGIAIGSEDTTSPYGQPLDTTTLPDGGYTLTAIARDTAGNTTTSAPVVVTVNNTAPPTGTPTLVQHLHTGTNATNEIGNSFKITLPNAVLANNCLIVAMSYQYSAGRTIQIVDNAGTNVYLAGPSVNNGAIATRVYYASGVAAGTQTLTVTFNAPVYNFQADVSEFYHVAVTSAYDGGAGSATAVSPSVTAGSVTPSAAGDLIYQYAIDVNANVIGFNHFVSSITAGSGFTLLASDTYGIAAQYKVQDAVASVSPTLSVAVSASDPYNTVVLALRSSSAGTAPAPGIRIVHETHVHAASTSQPLSVPSIGNLIVLSTSYPTDQGYSINSVSDNKGNSYTRLTPNASAGQMLYTPRTAATGPDLRITINGSDGIPYVIYDIVGAAPVAFDTYTVAIRGQTGPQSDITDAPIITPNTPNGLVLAVFPVGTGPVSGIIGSVYIFDSVFYTGQTDCSGCMDSADGYAHVYNVGLSTLHFNWHVTNAGGATDGGALAVAFKGQGGT
jgi:Bacterial Ig domain